MEEGSDTTAPLAGITVLGLEQAIAAPLCTRHLADLGARVIKIEHPGSGDSARYYDGAVRGMAAHFVWLNHGKESAALDLTDPADREVFTCLLDRADVLVSNLAPGALPRLGLAPQALAERYPRLIIVDISGYGTGGPLDHKRAYDLLVQAEGGSCAITGLPGQPAKPGIPIADIGTALYAYSAVLAALYDRERTGRGTVVPLAMLDVVAEMMGFALNHVLHGGEEPRPVGMGSPVVAPYSAYATGDGQTVVLGTTSDREWRRLASDLLGRPELAEDPRFARNEDRASSGPNSMASSARGARDEISPIFSASPIKQASATRASTGCVNSPSTRNSPSAGGGRRRTAPLVPSRSCSPRRRVVTGRPPVVRSPRWVNTPRPSARRSRGSRSPMTIWRMARSKPEYLCAYLELLT